MAVALCVVSAASASAAQWYVGGKAMTGSEKLSETVKVEESIVFADEFAYPKYFVNITCTGLKLPKSEISASAAISLKEPRLEGCKLTIPRDEKEDESCALEGTEIWMSSLTAKMSLGSKSPEDGVELKPSLGNEWFAFGGRGSCEISSIDSEGSIIGTVTLKAVKGQTEAVEQEFVGEGEAGKGLTRYGAPVYFTGKFKLKLASGKAWSFH
jgi:hypothetical protein